MNKRILGYVALWAAVAGGSLQAHHSLAGVYDMKAEKELTGTVATVKFVNPHGSMSIMVKNDTGGGETEWVFTLGSATALAGKQVGKTGPNALHVGDTITVKCIPAKDGHPLGFLKSITYADGHVIVVSGGNPND
jgi:regulator of RNase E activity RraA